YVKVDPRPGDVIEDVLVAEHEKAFTEIVKFEEKPYFMYSPGKAVKNNLFEAINTQNQPAMPKNKLKAIILEPFK
ncbi:MAG: hypothetical protein OEZ01_16040, partial [Candidatus Heimdallarchaeota archaeon]|nr:hypothetical protein [Candidatus Heimdallarchaeota archaeon]